MTDFDTQVAILSTFQQFVDNDDWKPFKEYANIGLPLAWMIQAGMVTKWTKAAEKNITDAFETLCLLLTLDPKGDYTSLGEMFQLTIEKANDLG